MKVETLEGLEFDSQNATSQNQDNAHPSSEQEQKAGMEGTTSETSSSTTKGKRPRIPALTSKVITIRENQGGITYKGLFGDYLRTAKEIRLTDPFIRQPYQIDNLVDFIQMVRDVTSVQDTIKIHLSTQNEDDEKVAEVIDSFNDLADELLPLGIEFTYDFKADHDRMIQTDTGWTITLGRGLDIYEKFGRFSLSRANQQNRRCKAFNVSINHTQNETNN